MIIFSDIKKELKAGKVIFGIKKWSFWFPDGNLLKRFFLAFDTYIETDPKEIGQDQKLTTNKES